MTTITLVILCFIPRLCHGFVIVHDDRQIGSQYPGHAITPEQSESIDYMSGYKIVSINGKNVEDVESFKEIRSREEYSQDDVQIDSLIPALKKGLKKVSQGHSSLFNNDVFRVGFLIKLISNDLSSLLTRFSQYIFKISHPNTSHLKNPKQKRYLENF